MVKDMTAGAEPVVVMEPITAVVGLGLQVTCTAPLLRGAAPRVTVKVLVAVVGPLRIAGDGVMMLMAGLATLKVMDADSKPV